MSRIQFLLFVWLVTGLVDTVHAADCGVNAYACGSSACCSGSDICCSNAAGACCHASTPYCCDDGTCAVTPSACVHDPTDAGIACSGYAIPCGGTCIPAGSDCCNARGDHCPPTEACTSDDKCAVDGTSYPLLRKLEGAQTDAATLVSPALDPAASPSRTCAVTLGVHERPVPLLSFASSVACTLIWRRKRLTRKTSRA
jgi:hypothetical protein